MSDHVRRDPLPPERAARLEALDAEIRAAQAARKRRVLLLVGILGPVIVGGAIAAIWLSDELEKEGSAEASDGIPAVARVERAPDGDCTLTRRKNPPSHCYGLELNVFPEGGPPFPAKVDVNVADRWASRVQPGSYVWVVIDRTDRRKVYLNRSAFAEPAPAPPEGAAPRSTPGLTGAPRPR